MPTESPLVDTVIIDTAALARLIDHTMLKPETTSADVSALVAEAIELGAYSVCVPPSLLPVRIPSGSDLKVTAVCGFPSGMHDASVKQAEARLAIERGADEIDMVINIGAAKNGDFDVIRAEIAAVRGVVPPPRILKVILESATLTDDEIVAVCRAAVAAGADFVKTSTGFHPAGGASVEAVRLMAQTVDGALSVKASGGIRSLQNAYDMIAAGATRLGVSGSRALLAESESGLPSVLSDSAVSSY